MLAIGSLGACERWLVPFALATWKSPEPAELRALNVSPNIELGTLAPEPLRNLGLPLDVVVHVECLGCRVNPPEAVLASFRMAGVQNLVLAADRKAYLGLAKLYPRARIAFGEPDLIDSLHAAFGPRLYRFDINCRLFYVQNVQPDNYERFLASTLH